MGIVATLLPNPARLQRLRAAVRGRHALLVCEDWHALTRACEAQPVQLAVLDLYAGGTAGFERVRVLRQRFPRLGIVAYIGLVPERAHDLFEAGRFGLDALVLADQDDAPLALAALLERAETRSVVGLVRRATAGLDALVRDALLLTVSRATERLSPTVLARIMGISRRSLSQHLSDAGFPPPQRLITWGRLIVSAHLLEDHNRSADGVALALRFPSGSAFRNTCQRYLHATPREIRARGGGAYVLRVLLRQRRVTPGPSMPVITLRPPTRLPQVAV